jgi:hypothetical protein
MSFNGRRGNQHALQTTVTKRFSSGWQASGTYTLSVLKDAGPLPRNGLELGLLQDRPRISAANIPCRPKTNAIARSLTASGSFGTASS